ncbi:hypothetical protein, partial [Massilia psychrophila]
FEGGDSISGKFRLLPNNATEPSTLPVPLKVDNGHPLTHGYRMTFACSALLVPGARPILRLCCVRQMHA